ncbi:hypothetical protein P7K49_023119 [Saguinus oedipus]|uniref:Uncharacterized protein n=1 Tax=Saguinus oedipus TaxID=9490 RepID=A0ABQ9UKQ6_SAGOE|nr:hypothetical protein P7K49_023119 [Saguinus oedipus]
MTITPPEPSPPKGEAGCVDRAAETKWLPSRELLPRQKAFFRHRRLHAGGGPGPGLLEGFSGWAALVVLSQVLNGLLMSAVMMHSSSMAHLFVVACSLVVNAELSAVLLRLQLTAAFFLAILLIGLAMRLYYGSR